MKKIAKIIRIITIPPFSAMLLNIIIYFTFPNSFNNIWELLLIILVTGLIPVLAYPYQALFHPIKNMDERDASRKLSIIFSIVSYSIGFLISLIFDFTYIQTLVYYTYFFSGVFMGLFNFILHIKASGHLCGISGPVAVLIYSLGVHYLFLIGIVLLVVWSSIYLKRHKYPEIITGTLIPIVSMFLSMGIILL
ncbi:MAG: hypothetical protein PHC62_02900 [Candidatus Izemoplasmatales bacterium]|jgi:hypothetical protein|nr:hypothetical protein [Candidatus Izemoplasmatales bacterium]